METRKASLNREWEPLTDKHERELERAQESFVEFGEGEEVDPLALVGAYRSGKTQLIYHLFNYSWELGIPAFYIGDPGEMLTNFSESNESNLNTWIRSQIDDQLQAYVDNDPSKIRWFPNIDTDSKAEFVESHGSDIDLDETVQTALFFDEVEQSYREFMRAMDKDDDNPLRKINDGLQDSIKVWSFGMISAFEFIGEADWGRMREIRIPPLEVSDVREMLQEERPDATQLSNVIWWLARGRTGLIIKLIDSLPADVDTGAVDWLRDLSEAKFRDTRPINNLWTSLDRENWEAAIKAIMFLDGGFDSWQIEGENALSATQCQHIAVNILEEEYSFNDTEDHQDAKAIVDRNIERVFSALAVTEEALFPTFGLSDQAQADAFLDLVSDMTVSFEPASDARSTAVEALDTTKGVFHTNWIERASAADHIDEPVATAAPQYVRDAFPPIAVNPERVSGQESEKIKEAMERGLRVETGTTANETVTIRFCPTVEAFEADISELVNSYDLTDPTVLVIPDDEDFDQSSNSDIDVYRRHNLLKIETYQSNRFWTFIINIFGRLNEEGLGDPYRIDDTQKEKLVSRSQEREVRNTIETLYDQLRQVANEQLESLSTTHRDTYSLSSSNRVLWEEERLNGEKPYWSNGEFVESTIALSYLPLFGPEYEANRDYSKLYKPLQSAITQDLVSGNKGGFQFKSYFDDLFTQNGYSDNVSSERNHYEENGQIAPAVKQTRDSLTALAKLSGVHEIVDNLDDPSVDIQNGQVPVVSVPGLTHLGYGLIRALTIAGLTTGPDPEIDIVSRLNELKSEIDSELATISEYKDQVEARDSQLSPPDCADVGSWIEINSSRLDQYESNLKQVQTGIEDLIQKVQADSAAGPVAYHYWFLINIYIDDIGDQIDDLESKISAASVSDISEVVHLFESVHDTVSNADHIEMHFDNRQALLSRVEDYADNVFDLESHLGSTEISIPEDNQDLKELNETISEHTTYFSSLERDLDQIEGKSEELRSELEESRELLMELLAAEEVSADD